MEAADSAEADEKGNDSEYAKAAVNETPERGNAAEWTGDESQGNDGDAGDHAKLKYPLVADRIKEGPEEGDGEHEVGEGQPVRTVGEERVVDAVVVERSVDPVEPKGDMARKQLMIRYNVREPTGFGSRGKVVMPLRTKPRIKSESQSRMERRSWDRVICSGA